MSLPRFGKKKVTTAALIIRKTGDSLSDSLKFEPVALEHGDEVFLVVKGVVVDVHHPAEDRKEPGTSDLRRVHIVDAQEVAMVGEGDVEPLLKAAADRIAKFRVQEALAEEQAMGITRLPMAEPDA
jgi:hypothetical protein